MQEKGVGKALPPALRFRLISKQQLLNVWHTRELQAELAMKKNLH